VVRSKLAYGLLLMGVDDVKILEPVQNEGIRIALGAVRSTPRAALIAESRLPTLLQLRASLAASTYLALKRDTHEDLFQLWHDSPDGPEPADTTFGVLWDSIPPLPGFAQVAMAKRLSPDESELLDRVTLLRSRPSPAVIRRSTFAVAHSLFSRKSLSSSHGWVVTSPSPPSFVRGPATPGLLPPLLMPKPSPVKLSVPAC
jgi:hypothetical protein